jgi:FkbM family methyltransferase
MDYASRSNIGLTPEIVAQNRQAPDLEALKAAAATAKTGEPLKNATVNYALNRPATQSSVSGWSRNKTPEEEAAGGNDGNVAVDFGCHTGEEHRPWWQVDLGNEIVITKIVIYNRQKCAYRLRYFSLYGSSDGVEWKRFYKRTSAKSFGESRNDKLIIVPEHIVIARFVRLQLDCTESLHFRECEIYGRAPVPEDYAQIGLQEALLARQEALVAGRIGFIQKIGAHAIFVDEINYGLKVVEALQTADYELEERRLTEEMLLPADRVLEVGTGIGVVSMAAADRTSPAQVRTFDGNPYIVADAKKNFAFNGKDGITATVGVLRSRAHLKPSEKTLKFTVLKDFWASHIGSGRPGSHLVEIVDVPILCLEHEIAAHRANVLIIDIEGGEIDLLDGADLSPIRLIIMETHYWAAGVEATDKMIRDLIYQGFNIDVSLSRYGVVVLRRDLDKLRQPLVRKLFSPLSGLRRSLA